MYNTADYVILNLCRIAFCIARMSLATLLPTGCLWIEKLTYGLSCSSFYEALIYTRDQVIHYTYDERISSKGH